MKKLLAASVPLVGLASVVGLLGGCRSCKNDRPYVPYAIGEAGVTPAASASAVGAPDAGAFTGRAGVVAAPEATRWALDGLDLAAPPERIFAMALSGDFDGDGAVDAVAVVRRPGTPDLGEVALYRGTAHGLDAPTTLATPPPVPLDPSCSPSQRLAQVGRHSVAVELVASCAGHEGAAAPPRWLAVMAFGRDASVHYAAQITDPPGAPALTVDVDGADRDGDGLDDVTLRITLEGGGAPFEPGPKVAASLLWFDRPAGMSRDPEEPEKSLRALAGTAAARAKGKDAASVPPLVRQVRSLFGALCADGGAPRIVPIAGARPFACGPSRALEDAGLAEVRAEATLGDALRAIAALDRAELPPATRTAKSVADAEAAILRAAPVRMAAEVRALSALPEIERGRAPSWGAMAFEPSGMLLVRTPAGVVRVDPAQGGETPVPDLPPWKSAVLSPDGALRWIEAYDACDAVALHATFASTAGSDVRDVPLPIAPLLGTKCASAGAHGEPVPALPIAWSARGLEAIVAGEPLLFTPDLTHAAPLFAPIDAPFTLGAPRSPSATANLWVVPTSQGILVRSARSRLYRARELEGGYLELRDCAISDDASRVACVRGGGAFAGVWPTD